MAVVGSQPGVYVEELPDGARTIVGVDTSIGMFIGRAYGGELYKPVLCRDYADFERAFDSTFADGDLAREVKLFFLNGGVQCYVARIADEQAPGSTLKAASVELLTEDGQPSLRVEARSPGLIGNDIRLGVSYDTAAPEAAFNLEVFRWVPSGAGALLKADAELYAGLSMNPLSPRYAVDLVDAQSQLVKLTDLSAAPSPTAAGFSQGARPIAAGSDGVFRDEVIGLFGKAARPSSQFRVALDGGPFQVVDLADLDFTAPPLDTPAGVMAALGAEIAGLINVQVGPSAVSVDFIPGPAGQAGARNAATRLIRVTSAKGDVRLLPGPSPVSDIAATLLLGAGGGGAEVSRWADSRPAPNGLVFNPKHAEAASNAVAFAALPQGAITSLAIAGALTPPIAVDLVTVPATAIPPALPIPATVAAMFQDKTSVQPAAPPDPVSDGVREKWGLIAAAVNGARAADPAFPWTARVWGSRLALLPAIGDDNLTGAATTAGTDIGPMFAPNVRYYSLGSTGAGAFQTAGVDGDAGGPPTLADYDHAFQQIDREVDLFNLLVLPKDQGHSDAMTRSLWAPASTFCQTRRAFLVMYPPADWTTSQQVVGPVAGVDSLRVGLVKDHAAIFYPRLKINEDGADLFVGPAGAIAGLIGRIDGTHGVWKTPSGMEADLRGVTGLESKLTDAENGVLNARAVNAIRAFPTGLLNWGARTLAGDDSFASDYKYIPTRRLALYIEESLARGLKWAVFEPNDEPLWAQIRLSVGAFLNGLFRQGAFQGATPADAYFVKCDSSITTQDDRDLGAVNILVGFAPLKPAEFVVLSLQQVAGQVQP